MLNKSGIKRRFENYVQYAGIEAQKVRENPDIKFWNFAPLLTKNAVLFL